VGGGHGTPFLAQVGLGGGDGGGAGDTPPGGSEQCATAAMALTTPGHGSPPCDVSVQLAWPTQVVRA